MTNEWITQNYQTVHEDDCECGQCEQNKEL